MKLVFLIITILINLFYPSLIKSEEKNDLTKNTIENIAKKESLIDDETEIKKTHIVKIGDTVSSISKYYSINKDLIIKLNNLKDENYIYVGQNLIISESNANPTEQSDLNNDYHIVEIGETLTEISNKYNLKLGDLIEINNLQNPDSIKVGEKLLLSKNNPVNVENYQIIKSKENEELLYVDKNIYGPIIIESKSIKKINGRKVLNIINRKSEKFILSIKCDTKELDVRIPGRQWKGPKPAKEEFEVNLINDFC